MADPRDAEITIVGGGAIGCAVAFYLAKSGYKDVQLIDKAELGGETSSQAAGLVGQVRSRRERTLLAMESVKTFGALERETGVSPEWRQTGSLRISLNKKRDLEFEKMALVASEAGLDVNFVNSRELEGLFPALNQGDISTALWCPSDGYLQPNSLVNAYVAGAKSLGVTFAQRCQLLGISLADNEITGIITSSGSFRTSTIINCAGPWASLIAQMVGIDLPVVPVRHAYFITEQIDGWHSGLPVLRIPDIRIYARAELSALLCGGWEANSQSVALNEITDTAPMKPDTDYDVLGKFAGDIGNLIQSSEDLGVKSVFKGYPTFSPDGKFIIGPVTGIRSFIMAAACNAHGVSGSAGIAAHVVESMSGDPSDYVHSLSPMRFITSEWSKEDARLNAQSVYENYYAIST